MLVGVETVEHLASRADVPNLCGNDVAPSVADDNRAAMRLLGVIVATPGTWGCRG